MRCAVYKVLLPVMMITEHRQTHTHRHTETKTVYPPVSLRSLGGYNKKRNLKINKNQLMQGPEICEISPVGTEIN